MNTFTTIQEILREIKPTKNLSGVCDIIDGGYLDSFELMSLIAKLDEVFEVEIDVEEITAENFNSINAIADMINRIKAQ